jgi:CheY-like chemotaxis protein
MPDEDGLSFIRKVRALATRESADVPAIALTAYARAQDRARAVLAGFNTHVAKPVEALELFAVVLRLSGRGARQPHRAE